MSKLSTIQNFVGKKSPTLLVILSIGGLIGTVGMAIKATPKVVYMLDDERHYREESEDCLPPMSKYEIFKMSWTHYIPTMIMGAATVASIIGSNTINLRRNAALTSAYYLSETALKEYQAKIIETIGANKAKLIKEEIAQDRVTKTKKDNKTIIITGNGDTLCHDQISGRYFKSSVDKIRKAENLINKEMMDGMSPWMSLNEIYDYLDLDPVSVGREIGWDRNKEGILEFDISTCMSEDDEPCISINLMTTVRSEY